MNETSDPKLLVDTLKLSFQKPDFLEIFGGLNVETMKNVEKVKNSDLTNE
jgi:hypothetical protein